MPHHGSPGFHLKTVVRAYEREASLNVPPEGLDLAMSAARIMRETSFRSRRDFNRVRDGRFTLDIGPLSAVVELSRFSKTSVLHDKTYALIWMCSDNLTPSGLLLDHNIT